jgi:hypothetical protein
MITLLDNLTKTTIQKHNAVEKLVNTNHQVTSMNKHLTETILMELQKQNATLDFMDNTEYIIFYYVSQLSPFAVPTHSI